MTKPLYFAGLALDELRAFPPVQRREAGYQLGRVQFGLEPSDWKPMTNVGRGVREIRIQHEGQYRLIYVAKLDDAVCVLHAFRKKTQKPENRILKSPDGVFAKLGKLDDG